MWAGHALRGFLDAPRAHHARLGTGALEVPRALLQGSEFRIAGLGLGGVHWLIDHVAQEQKAEVQRRETHACGRQSAPEGCGMR